jgi:hypothetical protein
MNMKETICLDIVTHLLGYLTPEQWADAIATHSSQSDRDRIGKLIRIQEKQYGFDLWSDVTTILEEKGLVDEKGAWKK